MKYLPGDSLAIRSSMFGIGSGPITVIWLSLRKSIQNRLAPSFFLTNAMGDA